MIPKISGFLPLHLQPPTTMSDKNKWVDFQFVRSNVGFAQVLEHYQLTETFRPQSGGKSLRGPCPIHKGTNTDGFSIELEKNIWICHSKTACSSGGNILDFVAKMEGVALRQAALLLVEWFNLPDSPGKPNPAESKSERPSKSTATQKHAESHSSQPPENSSTLVNKPLKFTLSNLDERHPYLYHKGLTDESILEFDLGYCSKGMMTGRIVVPIRNADGELVAYAGRLVDEQDGEPKWKMPPGYFKTQDVFNLHSAFNNPLEMPLIVVEGFFDAIKLHQQGHRKVVALMGTHMSEVQEQLIAAKLKPDSQVFVMFDDDEAGHKGRCEVAGRLALHCAVTIRPLEFEC